MINDLDRTLREILTKELRLANGRLVVQFDQPSREWSSAITQPTLNLFLYDLRENNVLRQHQWQQATQKNGNGRIQQKRTSFRVECHYILTAWTPKNPNRAEDEHQLLSNAMLVLFRHPELPSDYLQGVMRDQPFEISARLAAHDRLTNPAELWSALDNELRPSVSYIVNLAFDPWQEIEILPVRTLTIRTDNPQHPPSMPNPPKSPRFFTSTSATRQAPAAAYLIDRATIDFHFIAGTVRKELKPQANLDIVIQGTNFGDKSDENGRYALGRLAPGQYTLIIAQDDEILQKRIITVPLTNKDDDYDIQL